MCRKTLTITVKRDPRGGKAHITEKEIINKSEKL